MEESILKTTKKILGLAPEYTAFDLDVITHINSALADLSQIGLGPPLGLAIQDESVKWSDLGLPPNVLSLTQTYIYLKVRMLFDPPTTSFHIEAMNKQIDEHEYRLSVFREELLAATEST